MQFQASLRSLFVALGFATAALPTSAATIDVKTIEVDGERTSFILVEGELAYGDEGLFVDAALRLSDGVVILSGPGGNVHSAIEIGKAIRLKGFATAVASGDMCASACALAWLGGRMRLLAEDARIGFHAVSLSTDPNRQADSVGNALVGAYLNELNLPANAIAYITQAQPDDMRWLTIPDARRVGIEVTALTPDKAEPEDKPEGASRPETPATARPATITDNWTSYGEWIQTYSRPTFAEAEALAEFDDQRLPDTFVFLYDNGWYVVAMGPYPSDTARAERNRLVSLGEIPNDSLVTTGRRFTALVWGGQPTRPAMSALPPRRDPQFVALNTARAFFSTWSGPNGSALGYLATVYTSEVDYYGKPTNRSAVLAEKTDFVERWPVRSYVLEPGTRTSCRPDGTCVVSGTVRWHTYSSARNSTSIGTARFSLTVSTNDPVRIIAESSEVLTRQLREGR